MDANNESQEVDPHKELDEVMDKLERHTKEVAFHKNPETSADKAANEIFDGLMYVLAVIGDDALEKTKGDGPKSEDYKDVLRTTESLAHVARGLADDRIPIHRNTRKEEAEATEGDKITAYRVTALPLDQHFYEVIDILIRPQMHIRPTGGSRIRRRLDQPTNEQAQARMQIKVKPRDLTVGETVIRLDQEDLEHGMILTYDVIVGKRDLLRDIDTGYEGQEGHHFSSQKTAQQLGCTFKDILLSYDKKFSAVAAS